MRLKMNTKNISTFLILFAVLSIPSLSFAGTKIYGEGATLEEAMDVAKQNVEAAAKKAKRCVSEYPKLETCEIFGENKYRCRGIRANKKGSCN